MNEIETFEKMKKVLEILNKYFEFKIEFYFDTYNINYMVCLDTKLTKEEAELINEVFFNKNIRNTLLIKNSISNFIHRFL